MIARNGSLAGPGSTAPASQLPEGLLTGAPLDHARDALREQQPPRDQVAVPRVDDDLHVLIEEIALDDGDATVEVLLIAGCSTV
jgi:hypothetical protein